MSLRNLIRWSGLAIMLVGVLAAVAGMSISMSIMSVHAQNPAQPTTDPETILSVPDGIQGWLIGGGFIYWYESCKPSLGETSAFLNRRAVNGTIVQNLVNINDVNDCETLIGSAVDDSGFYYYNRSAGTIEAIYTDTPTDPPATLATVIEDAENEISAMFLDEDFVYWIEVEYHGEHSPQVIRIRRVSKNGGTPATLLTYDGYNAGDGMAITADFIWWTDYDGLQRLGKPKPPCPENAICRKTLIHARPTRGSRLYLNEAGDLIWWDPTPFAEPDSQYLLTRCPDGITCQTQTRYTAPDLTTIPSLVATPTHMYWTESTRNAGKRLRRLPLIGGSPQNIIEEGFATSGLAVDNQGVYFRSEDLRRILRLPLDAEAIQRQISFGGWEVTQAIQNIENDVPLVAGKQTYVRVYPVLNSGSSSAGVQALLYGTRNGVPLPDSPLYSLIGNVSVNSSNAHDNRADLDSGWLFQLPLSWTKDTPDSIPLEDSELTLRVVLDPLHVTGDTTPSNNSAEETFTFVAKAPACVNLRPVWTEAYQSPWDQSVASVIKLAASAHPTPRFLAFPEYNRLEETEWCWKWYGYGPYCSGPYELNDDTFWLLNKMGVQDYFHDDPSVCIRTGARTLYAGIVSAKASSWSANGIARRGGDQFLSKVPRYGTWSWPLAYTVTKAMTFVHEVGHNYDRRHVDCAPPGADRPANPDTNYPYITDTLDHRPLYEATTYFGFDTRLLMPIPPDINADYMSYCPPRWASDYTWRAIFDNTRHAGDWFPLPLAGAETTAEAQADAYVLVSGLITPSILMGTLSPAWSYPTAEASESLIQKWEAAVAEPWPSTGGLTPYHVRVLGSDGAILTDRAIILAEVEDHDELEVNPFQVVYPALGAPVQTVQLMADETVLASFSPGTVAPEVAILSPQDGATVEDEVTLEWTAADPDGTPWLAYTVQYSPDLGEHWYALVADRRGPGHGVAESLPLDLRGQPGSVGKTALLRVIASDGYNSGLATSEPFSVSLRAPDVIITAPEEGQWFAAGEPVLLDGDAFDPEDGVLNDNAFHWSLLGLDINERWAVALGLAPGAYTATLQTTDSDGAQGSTQVSFHVAPLDVPLASSLTLDGNCNDLAYVTAGLPLAPYAAGDTASVTVIRTADHLWVCLQGLQSDDGYAGLTVDVDNSQDTTVQAGDRGFFVQMDGTPVAMKGDEGSFMPVPPGGMTAHVSGDGATWNAELRVEADALGGWNRRVALSIGHYLDDGSAVWPFIAALENPQSWAQTNLGAGETLRLTALSPESAVLGDNLVLTITGSGFQPDTVILWDGDVLTTKFVKRHTLEATVDAGLIDHAGRYQVQVAPGDAPLLASVPLPFLVYNPQATLGDLTPASAPMGGADFTLTVNGAGFVDGATVLWNGEARPTRFVSSTRLTAEISAEDLADARPVSVTVANPDPNVDISAAATFTVFREAFQLYLPHVQSN